MLKFDNIHYDDDDDMANQTFQNSKDACGSI